MLSRLSYDLDKKGESACIDRDACVSQYMYHMPRTSLTQYRPGDQHTTVGKARNPFEQITPRLSEYTSREIATLSSRLEKQLGPEYISSRPGAGGAKVHYLAAEKCINLANDVFGFNGWSSGIQNIQIDFVSKTTSQPDRDQV